MSFHEVCPTYHQTEIELNPCRTVCKSEKLMELLTAHHRSRAYNLDSINTNRDLAYIGPNSFSKMLQISLESQICIKGISCQIQKRIALKPSRFYLTENLCATGSLNIRTDYWQHFNENA